MSVATTSNPGVIDRARQVELILSRVSAIPALSPLASRIQTINSSDASEVQEITKIIETDPALSARILGLCRRADKGAASNITSVKRAVVMLGVEAVRAAVLSVDAYQSINTGDKAERAKLDASVSAGHGGEAIIHFDRQGLWQHSIAVACAAELIASRHPRLHVVAEEAFLAGMMHDVGKLALEFTLPKAYERVIQLAARRASDAAPVERAILGLDHYRAGGKLAEHWNLPEPIRLVIQHHGDENIGEGGTSSRLVVLTALARTLTRLLHVGWSGDFGMPPEPEAMCRVLGIPEKTLPGIISSIHGAVADRLNVLGLGDHSPTALMLRSIEHAHRNAALVSSRTAVREMAQRAQAKILDAITQYHARRGAESSLEDFATGVLTSAHTGFGEGWYALVIQPKPGEDVEMAVMDEANGTVKIQTVARATSSGSLARDCAAQGRNASVLQSLPRMLGALQAAPEARNLRVTPLPTLAPAAALIHSVNLGELPLREQDVAALLETWVGASIPKPPADFAPIGPDTPGLAALRAALPELRTQSAMAQGGAQLLSSRVQDATAKSAAREVERAMARVSGAVAALTLLHDPPTPTFAMHAWRGLMEQASRSAGVQPMLENSDVPDSVRTDGAILSSILAAMLRTCAYQNGGGAIAIRAGLQGSGDRFVITIRAGEDPRSPGGTLDQFVIKAMSKMIGATSSDEQEPGRGRIMTLALSKWRAEEANPSAAA